MQNNNILVCCYNMSYDVGAVTHAYFCSNESIFVGFELFYTYS